MSNNEPKLRSKSGSIAAYSALVYIVVIFFAILAILSPYNLVFVVGWVKVTFDINAKFSGVGNHTIKIKVKDGKN